MYCVPERNFKALQNYLEGLSKKGILFIEPNRQFGASITQKAVSNQKNRRKLGPKIDGSP
jgi:hypothetical protein